MSGRTFSARDRHQLVWDGLGLDSPFSGVGHYGSCLYRALSKLQRAPYVTVISKPPVFVDVDRLVYVSERQDTSVQERQSPEKFLRLKPVFPNISYRASTKKFSSVLYHGLSNVNLPCFYPKRPQDRHVITIHDLIPLIVDKWSPLGIQTRILLPRVIHLADAIIVPSDWTRRTLIEYYGDQISHKINVIPNGSRPVGLNSDDELATSTAEIGNDVLSVARGESYKRLELIAHVARAIPDVRFLLVTDQRGMFQIGTPPKNLRILREISQTELERIYCRSRVFLHPSLFEGWCLPVADALQAGLITLFVKGTGVDDVCRFAPHLAVGLSAKDAVSHWVDATLDALERAKYSTPVKQGVHLPSWSENAEKTLKIYDSLI